METEKTVSEIDERVPEKHQQKAAGDQKLREVKART
jgi:hypothetical protein